MDTNIQLLSFIIVPLIFVLLQYYGFPLLDRISLYLWKSAKRNIQTFIQKRKNEYEQLVESMLHNNIRDVLKYEIRKEIISILSTDTILLMLYFISFQLSILLVSVGKDNSFKITQWCMLLFFYLTSLKGILSIRAREIDIKAINEANRRLKENKN
jgi:hypothetical protein